LYISHKDQLCNWWKPMVTSYCWFSLVILGFWNKTNLSWSRLVPPGTNRDWTGPSNTNHKVEDARWAVVLPLPMLGHCLPNQKATIRWKVWGRWWGCHHSCWVVIHQIRGHHKVEGGRWVVELGSFTLGCYLPNQGANVRWKAWGGQWSWHPSCWVISHWIRGQHWCTHVVLAVLTQQQKYKINVVRWRRALGQLREGMLMLRSGVPWWQPMH